MSSLRFPAPRAALGVLAVASALAACACAPGADSPLPGSSPSSTLVASVGEPPSREAPAGVTPLGDADENMKTLRPEAPTKLVVTNARVGRHDGFERVVFEFVGEGDPGWFIDFSDQPTQQGSGKPIPVKGKTSLNVNIDGTVLPYEIGAPDPHLGTVPGDGGFVTEVVSAGTFEGRSQFIIGLEKQHPYSVQVLKGPTRLVIDILQTS